MTLSSTRSSRGLEEVGWLDMLGEDIFGVLPMLANSSEDDISRPESRFGSMVLFALEPGASTGNGNSVTFSFGPPGVEG